MSKKEPLDSANQLSERRQRNAISDELKIQLARERFANEWVEVSELAVRHGRAATVVSRAIQAAFREGLVEVRQVRKSTPRRLESLEREIRRRFPTLRVAMVVDADPAEQDSVHENLGRTLATDWCGARFVDRERIVIGAGRCVYHMAETLAEMTPKLQMRGVKLFSVGGDSYPYHERKRNVSLDADANARLIVQAFEEETTIALSSHHVFIDREAHEWKRQYYEQLRSATPTIAILGVGILNELHQLYLLTNPRTQRDFPPTNVTEGLSQEILALRESSKQLASMERDGAKHCIAELGMHLYFVPGESAGPLAQEIRRQLESINRQLFAPHHAELEAIQGITLVAGGAYKAPAIKHLLQTEIAPNRSDARRAIAVHVLCTDRACAQALLA